MPGGARSDRPDWRRDRKIPTSGRRRYWAAADGRDPDLFWIDPDEVHHVRDVMRHRSGDRIELLDGSGRWFEAELDHAAGGRLSARLIQAHAACPEPPLPWLVQAMIRPARLEFLADGATQIGVRGILLFTAARSSLQDGIDARRRERLHRVMRAATAQSLGLRVPELRGPCAAAELARAGAGFRLWIAHGPAGSSGLWASASDLLRAEPLAPGCEEALVIGPEGGFTDEEVQSFLIQGGRLLDLGPRRLRAETAALVGLAYLGARLRASSSHDPEESGRSGWPGSGSPAEA